MEVDMQRGITTSATMNNYMQPPTQPQAALPFQSPSQQQQQQMLGLVIPGGPVHTEFVPVDNTGTKFALSLSSPGDLPSPLTLVNEIVCYLSSPLPADRGLLIYWQLSSQQEQSGFELLGSLTMDRPSAIFRTGWSEHDQFMAVSPQAPATISIGVSMESIDYINNLNNGTGGTNSLSASQQSKRPLVAQRIAQDLYNFMQSFDTSSASVAVGNQYMVVPKNIFERWWKRFETKSKRDPNFFLKNVD